MWLLFASFGILLFFFCCNVLAIHHPVLHGFYGEISFISVKLFFMSVRAYRRFFFFIGMLKFCRWDCVCVTVDNVVGYSVLSHRKKTRVLQTRHSHISYTIWTITYINVYNGLVVVFFFSVSLALHSFFALLIAFSQRHTHTDAEKQTNTH